MDSNRDLGGGDAFQKRYYISYFLFGFALYLGLYSNSEKFAAMVQMASVSMVIFSAIYPLLGRKVILKPLSALEALFMAACFLSCCSCLFFMIRDGAELAYSIVYTVLFLLVILSLGLLSSFITCDQLIRIAAIAYTAMILSAVALAGDSYAAALAINADDRWALRFTPFDMHPNLVGFVFGGGGIIFLYRAWLVQGRIWKAFYIFQFFMTVSFIMASSARASLLAIAVSSMVVLLVQLRNLGARTIMTASGVAGLALLIILINFDVIYQYVSDVLEFDSSTRGVDSGATGRTELWAMGINLIFSDPFRTFFGGGLRSASPDLIGFSTESSYITVVLESGVVLGLSIIFFLGYFIRSLGVRLWKATDVQASFLLHILFFVAIQSIFNRYMIAVGNSFSMLLLFIYVYLSRRFANVRV